MMRQTDKRPREREANNDVDFENERVVDEFHKDDRRTRKSLRVQTNT